jgi:hypothetical protein
VREVAAHADPLLVRLVRRACRARVLVAEFDVLVREIDDGLHAPPAERRLLEELPREVEHEIDLTVAARQQIEQRLGRQRVHGMLGRVGTTTSGSPLSFTTPSA